MNRTVTPADTGIILDSISDGVFTVDTEWRITSFNRAAEEITGISREDAIAKPCSYVFRASICEGSCALRQTMKTGQPITNRPIYIIRGDGERVPVSISTAILHDRDGNVIGGAETFRDLSREEELRRELRNRHSFEDIISTNHRMRRLFDMLPAVADSPATVLVQGESGTGKELVSRAIHNRSPRSEGPFVAVNCGALPDALLESELFGYRAGAFTDARTDKPGLVARAEGGTLFLDEIGDISPALQVRLLRLLQEHTYEPLGGTSMQSADIRIITATHRNLQQMVTDGTFRRDLYYRINVVALTIPPLRERLEDIPLLAEHFIEHFNRLHDRAIQSISDEAMAALLRHDYPGNVRELENAIEHAFVLCRGSVILPDHLPSHFHAATQETTAVQSGALSLRETESRAIVSALKRNNGNKTAAARELMIERSTLYRKIREYGIPES